VVVAWMALHLIFKNLVLQPDSSWPDEQECEGNAEGRWGCGLRAMGAVALAIDASKASSIARLFWWIGARRCAWSHWPALPADRLIGYALTKLQTTGPD